MWISDELEHWPLERNSSAVNDTQTTPRFSKIACLHSELIAVSAVDGKLHQWRWCDPEPYKHPDVSFSE